MEEQEKFTALEILRTVAVEFSEVPAQKIVMFIELAKPLISERRFGENYQTALAYLAAHKMKMAGLGDTSMGKVDDALRVSSYSEGDVSIGFSVAQSNNLAVDAEYTLTSYGIQFLQLRRVSIIPILSAGERR